MGNRARWGPRRLLGERAERTVHVFGEMPLRICTHSSRLWRFVWLLFKKFILVEERRVGGRCLQEVREKMTVNY